MDGGLVCGGGGLGIVCEAGSIFSEYHERGLRFEIIQASREVVQYAIKKRGSSE